MTVKGRLAEELPELRDIGRELERILGDLYAPKGILRNTVKGVDFWRAKRRVAELEARLHKPGAELFDQPSNRSSESLRLARVYWCQIFLAATTLSEWISHYEEFCDGAGLRFGQLKDFVERFHDAMKGARRVWRKLYSKEREEIAP